MLLRRRASVVCVRDGELLCVRLRDPATRVARLFVPGGGIEAGEAVPAAAEREAFEETGYVVRVDAGSELVARYVFRWAELDVDCITHFFRGHLRDDAAAPALVNDAEYNEGVVWLPLARLELALGFKSEILDAVRALAIGGS